MMIGRERVVAGAATNSLLKVFDLRMDRGRAYSYLDATGNQGRDVPSEGLVLKQSYDDDICTQGWNIFSTPQTPKDRQDIVCRRLRESPIYSLSRPSSTSPVFYVGQENQVVQFNITSMLDKHPDPMFKHSLSRMKNGEINVKKTWDPNDKVMDLCMYDQTSGGDFALRVQRKVGPMPLRDKVVANMDERWVTV